VRDEDDMPEPQLGDDGVDRGMVAWRPGRVKTASFSHGLGHKQKCLQVQFGGGNNPV
jgi:hypothetical protein